MEPVQEIRTTAAPASTPGLFGTKIPASIAFLVAILLFLVPFAEIRCNGTAIANNTGLGIAMGNEWKEVASKNIFGNFGNDMQTTNAGNDHKIGKQDPNLFAIAALGLGVIGLLIAFLAPKSGGRANLIVGLLASAALIATLFDLRANAKSDNSLKSSDLGVNAQASITVDGTGAFYFAVILFILAGFLCYMRVRNKQPS